VVARRCMPCHFASVLTMHRHASHTSSDKSSPRTSFLINTMKRSTTVHPVSRPLDESTQALPSHCRLLSPVSRLDQIIPTSHHRTRPLRAASTPFDRSNQVRAGRVYPMHGARTLAGCGSWLLGSGYGTGGGGGSSGVTSSGSPATMAKRSASPATTTI